MKRFSCTDKKGPNWYESYGEPVMEEDTEGDYVLYSDVLPIIAENEKLKRTIEAIENEDDGICPVCCKEGCEPECDAYEEGYF